MTYDLPRFSNIDIQNIETQLTALLDHNQQSIARCLADHTTYCWDNLMQPIESLDDALHQFWSPISHLNAVMHSPDIRDAYNACLPKLSAYSTALSHNQAYYDAIASLEKSNHPNDSSPEKRKVIQNELRDFRLSGVTLPEDQKAQFKKITADLSALCASFDQNVLDATQAWTLHIDTENDIQGIPKRACDAAAALAKEKGKTGWVFTLEAPSYLAVMMHATSPSLRQSMYEAFVTRASDQGPNANQWDNKPIIFDILKKRQQKAKLLGFKHYAAYSLATKMVDHCDEVLGFLSHIASAAHEKAKQEMSQLKTFAKTQLGIETLHAWDLGYATEQLRKAKYDLSEDDLRPYFPEYKVLNGLFHIAHTLFGIDIQHIPEADTWHPDAACYAISKDDNIISTFYLDLYARPNKRGGAWMDDCRSRRQVTPHTQQTPIAFIVCNFMPPIEGQPALFSHQEVETLFHEFGHALQHMLTKINIPAVAGINGVPWDAVEIASQFMENYVWEKDALQLISEHHETKAPLPDALFDKMLAAKNFQSAIQTMRQIEFALFDFHLHMTESDYDIETAQNTLDNIRKRYGLIETPSYNRFQNAFSHIFAGGYAAGYYSYKWAEVMAQDIFSQFKEKGIFDPATSQKYLNTFLEMGGAQDPMDLFIQFQGRKPSVDALLASSGITPTQKASS